MNPLKPIETRYKGYRFRSRLEARWAVFFDALGVAWQYEPQGFSLPSGNYLPDFWLPNHKYWIEIKGEQPTDHSGWNWPSNQGMKCICSSVLFSSRNGTDRQSLQKHMRSGDGIAPITGANAGAARSASNLMEGLTGFHASSHLVVSTQGERTAHARCTGWSTPKDVKGRLTVTRVMPGIPCASARLMQRRCLRDLSSVKAGPREGLPPDQLRRSPPEARFHLARRRVDRRVGLRMGAA
jgi:hypothetical protein